MVTSKRIQHLKIFLDIILFIVCTGFLSYYSGNGLWNCFWITFFICLAVYTSIQILNSKYILQYLEELRRKEFRYTISGLKYGLQNFYNLQSDDERKDFEIQNSSLIKNAARLRCCSLTGTALLDSNSKKYFKILTNELLRNNKSVEIIIVNPFSMDKLMRDRVFLEAKNKTKKELDLLYRFKTYIELSNKYKNLSVLVSDYSFYCSIMLSEKEGIYEPYNLSASCLGFPTKSFGITFSLTKVDGNSVSYYDLIEKHYDTVKLNSIPLKQYIEDNNSKLIKLVNVDLLSLFEE